MYMYIIVETQNQTSLPVLTVFAAIQCSSDGGVPDVPGSPADGTSHGIERGT